MTTYPRSAYGTTDPNAGYPANGDYLAWGGWRWPRGVPSSLLGVTSYQSQSSGQLLRVVMRKELVPLWDLVFEIQDRKYHYPVWAYRDGEPWGPWGYENRAISGTDTASGHSSALSVDENAPNNPFARLFRSDMPPAMVHDLESLWLYWGGRYEGQRYDPMHYGFCRRPSDVAAAISRAKSILAGIAPPKPPPEVDMTPEECRAVVRDELVKFFRTEKPIVTDDRASTPNNVPYSYETGMERIIRLTSGTFVGESGQPH